MFVITRKPLRYSCMMIDCRETFSQIMRSGDSLFVRRLPAATFPLRRVGIFYVEWRVPAELVLNSIFCINRRNWTGKVLLTSKVQNYGLFRKSVPITLHGLDFETMNKLVCSEKILEIVEQLRRYSPAFDNQLSFWTELKVDSSNNTSQKWDQQQSFRRLV
jgi:hypothetical protein